MERILRTLDPTTSLLVQGIVVSKDKYDEIAKLVTTDRRERFKNERMSTSQVQDLLRVGIIEPIHPDTIQFYCNVFTIAETEKLRLIIEPRDLNRHFTYPKVHIPNINQMIEMIRDSTHLFQLDLACFFYQIPLSPQIRPFFGCMFGEKTFQLTCLPMGFVASVYVAQKIASLLNNCERPRLSMNYIDNIFGGATSERDALGFRLQVEIKANALGLAIKDGSRENGQMMDILGINCDAKGKTVRLSSKFTAKHRYILEKTAKSATMILTARSAMRIVGILCRVACVMQVPFYMLPNFLRVASEPAHPPIDSIVRLILPLQMRQLARIGLENLVVPVGRQLFDPAKP